MIGGGESDWEKQKLQAETGLHLFDSKDFKSATKYFQTALKKRPFESINHVMLGQIYLQQNEIERALYHAQQAIRLDNTVAESYLLMSKGLYELNDFDLSFSFAKKAVWFGRKNPETNSWIGKMLVEKGDIEKGIKYLEIAFAQGEENEATGKRSIKNKR